MKKWLTWKNALKAMGFVAAAIVTGIAVPAVNGWVNDKWLNPTSVISCDIRSASGIFGARDSLHSITLCDITLTSNSRVSDIEVFVYCDERTVSNYSAYYYPRELGSGLETVTPSEGQIRFKLKYELFKDRAVHLCLVIDRPLEAGVDERGGTPYIYVSGVDRKGAIVSCDRRGGD